MKTIIAGSRGFTNQDQVFRLIMTCPWIRDITEIVSGAADGADKNGEEWARQRKLKVSRFPADWLKDGKSAGFVRNIRMAEYADALIAIWDGKSPGTRHMINISKHRQRKVFVVTEMPV